MDLGKKSNLPNVFCVLEANLKHILSLFGQTGIYCAGRYYFCRCTHQWAWKFCTMFLVVSLHNNKLLPLDFCFSEVSPFGSADFT